MQLYGEWLDTPEFKNQGASISAPFIAAAIWNLGGHLKSERHRGRKYAKSFRSFLMCNPTAPLVQ